LPVFGSTYISSRRSATFETTALRSKVSEADEDKLEARSEAARRNPGRDRIEVLLCIGGNSRKRR
jgi:hypothetical protein